MFAFYFPLVYILSLLNELPHRLMVGQQTLTLLIVVRIHVRQPILQAALSGFFCNRLRRITFTDNNFLDNLINDIKENKIKTTYSHDNCIEIINGKTCLKFDCSGFAYYYFQKQHKLKALQEVRNFVARYKNISEKEIKRIYSKEYMLFFKTIEPKELNYWQIISSPGELTHGDLIVYISPNARENHCMLVDHTINVKDDAVVLQVVDSTQFPHKNDTRTKGQKGIGKGEITIFKTNGKWNCIKHNIYNHNGDVWMARAAQNDRK